MRGVFAEMLLVRGPSVGLLMRGVGVGVLVTDMPLSEAGAWLAPYGHSEGLERSGLRLSFLWGVELTGMTSTQAKGPPRTLCLGHRIRAWYEDPWPCAQF